MTASTEMDTKQAIRVVLGLVRLFGELAVLVSALLCTAFTSVASGTLLAFFLVSPEASNSPSLLKLGIKSVAFGVLSLLLALRLRWLSPHLSRIPYPKVTLKEPERPALPYLCVVVAAVGLFTVLNLSDYPRAEPDEMHHLIVARNLAVYGEYASGHPDSGFVRFDSYDSVGPTVILPVAGALKAAGIALLPARIVIVAFYIVMLMALYSMFLPLFDGRGAILGILFLSGALGTSYLARTLYGEIPALLFLVCGLLCWRRALVSRGRYASMLASGLFLGFAVITKMFAVFVVWAVLAAYLYDRLTFRRIQLVHLLLPAIAAGSLVLVWWGIQSRYQTVAEGVATGQLAVYQHNLMFGLGSVSNTLGWLFRHGAIVLVSASCMAVAGFYVFYHRYDPSVVVLWMFAVFVAFWWVFFTSGNIPRYVWYALALSASFVGPVVGMAISGAIRKRDGRWRMRPLRVFTVACLCVPFVMNMGQAFTAALSHDDMQADRALSEYVKSLPHDAEVATTFYPVERTLNFFADRHVTRISATREAVESHPCVILDAVSQRDLVDLLGATKRIERYAVYERTPQPDSAP
ncbi:MAG: glycosyltransferase family 39 protein [Candidatus Hydrogenedentes bacterium]|nr:glycosyltransferase family 39 protein [Candidatus Hydrogenedentota bacterium]